VGLIIPETVQAEERQQFEQMMHSLTMMQQQQVTPVETTEPTVQKPEAAEGEEKVTTSTKISKGILIGKLQKLI